MTRLISIPPEHELPCQANADPAAPEVDAMLAREAHATTAAEEIPSTSVPMPSNCIRPLPAAHLPAHHPLQDPRLMAEPLTVSVVARAVGAACVSRTTVATLLAPFAISPTVATTTVASAGMGRNNAAPMKTPEECGSR